MSYYAYSGGDIYYLYKHSSKSKAIENSFDQKLDWNYINPDAHDNIRAANEIVLVIYDEDFNPREHLTFRGIHNLEGWFDVNNILNSSNWDISSESNLNTFKMTLQENKIQMEISDSNENCRDKTGFLQLNCKLSENCSDFQWWKEDNSLQNKACAVQYSKFVHSMSYDESYLAKKFTIFTRKYFHYNETWLLNFRFSSSTPVYFWEFLNDGGVPSDGLNYRDKEIVGKFKKAKYLMLLLYDDSDNVVETFVFKSDESFQLDNWFNESKLIEQETEKSNFDWLLSDTEKHSFLNIGNKLPWLEDCKSASGRLTIACRPRDPADFGNLCPFQHFWNQRNGYCAIFYSKTKQGTIWNEGDYKFASKLEIATSEVDPFVLPWILVFRVQSCSYVDALEYFRKGDYRSTSSNKAVAMDKIYRHGNFKKKLTSASHVQIVLSTDDHNVVMQLQFQGSGNSEGWFHKNKFVSSATHDHKLKELEFVLDENGQTFYITKNISAECAERDSWLYVISTIELGCTDSLSLDSNSLPTIRFRDPDPASRHFKEEKHFEEASFFEIFVK